MKGRNVFSRNSNGLIVRSTFDGYSAAGGCQHQCRENGLKDKRPAAGTTNHETVISCLDRFRRERKRLRAWFGALYFRITNLSRSVDGCQMLTQKSWFVTPGANVVHLERLARNERERKRRAQHLPATFSLCAIDSDHFVPCQHLLCSRLSPSRKPPDATYGRYPLNLSPTAPLLRHLSACKRPAFRQLHRRLCGIPRPPSCVHDRRS
jgi:hypothetical protein